MFRLIRILKLVRYHAAIRRLGKAFSMAKEELIIFSLATLILYFYPQSAYTILSTPPSRMYTVHF